MTNSEMKRICTAILAIGLLVVVAPTTRLVNASCAGTGCTESPGQLQHPPIPHTDNTTPSAKTHTEGSSHHTKHNANSGVKDLIQLPSGDSSSTSRTLGLDVPSLAALLS